MRGSEATEPERAERARGGGGCPPPTVGRFFENLCMKMAVSSTLNDIIRGSYVRWHMYQSHNIFPLLKISFTPIKGDHGPLCILAIPVTVVQPGCVNGGQSKGAKWPRWGRVWEGVWGEGVGGGFPPPTLGRFFENLCMKTAFSSTLSDIIRGSYVRWHMYQSHIFPPFKNFFYSN